MTTLCEGADCVRVYCEMAQKMADDYWLTACVYLDEDGVMQVGLVNEIENYQRILEKFKPSQHPDWSYL